MPQASFLIASHGYSLEGPWFIACLSAVVVPPLLFYLHGKRWRLTIRGLVLLTVVASLVFTFMAWELRPYLEDSGRTPYWVSPDPGAWWAVPTLLLFSAIATTWAALVLKSLPSDPEKPN